MWATEEALRRLVKVVINSAFVGLGEAAWYWQPKSDRTNGCSSGIWARSISNMV